MDIVNEGKKLVLDHLTNTSAMDCKLHLFTNNIASITATTVIGDLTEATFGGYAAYAMTPYPDASINGSSEAEADSGTITFTASGSPLPQTCYGVYMSIKNIAGTRKLFAAAKFLQPQTVTLAGDTVNFLLNLFAQTYNP